MPPRTEAFAAGKALLLLAAVCLAYAPAIGGGLVWDDDAHVTRPELQTLHGLWRIWFDLGATQQYYPLLHSAFWIEHSLWGDATAGYHVVNIVLHAAAALLAVAILRRLAVPGAWLAGFLFALHPICVEAVAWISEQKSTLSAVLYLGAMLVYLDFDRTRRRVSYVLALGFFGLALASKSVTATLPAALLVILWWKRGRLEWRKDAAPLAPWLVLGAASGLFTAWVEQRYIGAHGATYALSGVDRVLIAGRALWFYFASIVVPAGLNFNYPRWDVDAQHAWQFLFPLGALAVAGGLGWLARRRRGPLAGFLLFAGTLFPALGFVNVFPFIYSYVADHFAYLATLAALAPLAAGMVWAADRMRLAAWQRTVLGGLLAAGLGALTWRQSGMYRDSVTLYRETARRNPSSWLAHNNLGLILAADPERAQEAIGEFEAALRANPKLAEAHNNEGILLAKLPGRLPEAVQQYREAIRIKPDLETARNDLGLALAQMPGRAGEAEAAYREAIRIRPDFAEAHYNLGLLLAAQTGRAGEAVGEYRAALRVNGNLMEVHNNLAIALAQEPGHLGEAVAEFEAALQLDPGAVNVHNNLGITLAQMPGRQSDAAAQFEEVLELQPDFEPARESLEQLRTAGVR